MHCIAPTVRTYGASGLRTLRTPGLRADVVCQATHAVQHAATGNSSIQWPHAIRPAGTQTIALNFYSSSPRVHVSWCLNNSSYMWGAPGRLDGCPLLLSCPAAISLAPNSPAAGGVAGVIGDRAFLHLQRTKICRFFLIKGFLCFYISKSIASRFQFCLLALMRSAYM